MAVYNSRSARMLLRSLERSSRGCAKQLSGRRGRNLSSSRRRHLSRNSGKLRSEMQRVIKKLRMLVWEGRNMNKMILKEQERVRKLNRDSMMKSSLSSRTVGGRSSFLDEITRKMSRYKNYRDKLERYRRKLRPENL